jgi:hypothetical protein
MGFAEQGTPDPEFKAFFAGDWKRLMETVFVPGMQYASWDRKAAYLLWCMGQLYDVEMPNNWQDALAAKLSYDVMPVPEPKPAMPAGGWGEVLAVPIVGNTWPEREPWPEDFDASTVKPVVNRVDPNGIDAAE